MNKQGDGLKGHPNHIQARPFPACPHLTMSWASSGSEGTKHKGHQAIHRLALPQLGSLEHRRNRHRSHKSVPHLSPFCPWACCTRSRGKRNVFRLQLMPEPKKWISSLSDTLQCKGSSSPLGLLLPTTKGTHSPSFPHPCLGRKAAHHPSADGIPSPSTAPTSQLI